MDWLSDVAAGLTHSIVHRPYVFVLLAIHLRLASWHLGWRRALAMTGAGYAIAWASELSSIHTGFPYGEYRYLYEALQGDLLVFGVPFFDSLSYSFLAYFSWAFALVLVAPPRWPMDARGKLDARLPASIGARRSIVTVVLAALLMTWLDLVVDPVSNLGDRWFLGKIYEYIEPGAHFGVPLSNYAGWFLTGLAIVFAYSRIDTWLGGGDGPAARELPFQAWFAPAAYFCVVAFALTITLWLGEWGMALAGAAAHAPLALWGWWRIASAPVRSAESRAH